MKKNFLKILSCSVLLAFTSACSQDMADQPAHPDNISNTNSHKVSLENALKRSKVFMDGLNDGISTRSMQPSDIESVKYLSSGIKTRSGDTDTIFYLVNYKNEQGFMLLSADKRTIPVYAMADDGELDINDTIFNEGLKVFFELAKADALSVRFPTDTTKFDGNIDIDPFDYTYDRTVKPLFSKNLRSIGQREPFNKYCKQPDGAPALVGCLPVAVGSILAYYHKPLKFKSAMIPWFSIDADIKNDYLYMLLDSICDKDLLDAVRETNATSAYPSRTAPTLKHFGIEYSNLQKFDDKKAGKALEEAPIIMHGQRNNDFGHSWIIDGYKRFGYLHNTLVGPEPGRSLPYFFFHCCWGWYGNSNGYFYYGTSGRIDGLADYYDDDDLGNCSTITYYNLKMNVKL